MDWGSNPEADELLAKIFLSNPDLSDREIANELKKHYPNQHITRWSVHHRRGHLGLYRPKGGGTLYSNFDAMQSRVLGWLRREDLSVDELSRRLDRSRETVIKILDSLKDQGYDVSLDTTRHSVILKKTLKRKFEPLKIEVRETETIKFGVVSDTHLCSKYQQLSLLHHAYKILDEEKVDFIICAGDIVEGRGMYRGQSEETFLYGYDEQKLYAVENFPRSQRGVKTYVCSGQHDYSFYKSIGAHLLRYVCEQREDLDFRGDFEASFDVKGLRVQVMHPSGSVSYATSYRPQKIAENLVASAVERMRESPDVIPHVLIFGHWHTPFYMPYMGMHCISAACFQSATPYLRQKGFHPVIGFWIITLTFNQKGEIVRIVPFFWNLTHLVREKDY